MTEIPVTIKQLVRRQNSADGNPRFNVVTSGGGSWTTKKDAQVGYMIQNFENKDVILTVDDNNEVVDVREATTPG